MTSLCFIDIETTGSIFSYHEIIEIGAIKTRRNVSDIVDSISIKVKPKHPNRITKIAQKINGYNSYNWIDSQVPNENFWGELVKFWVGCTPVCHNPSFERAFLSLSAFEAGIEDLKLDYHWIGTESLAWKLYLRGEISKLSLSSIAGYFNVNQEPEPHTALGGAKLCRSVYQKMMQP